ncbi:MAG: tetratricopeptide repeat protein [Acidobacteriota bacterium]
MSTLHPISGCVNTERKADVIFVHGLGGDAFSTWRHGKDASSSWPHWLGKEFPEIGVWSLGYAASPTRWARVFGCLSERQGDAGHSMSLPDRAGQVLDLMVQRGLGERPMMFTCHSLGGLLAKQILRKAVDSKDARRQQVARNTRAVLFLATPHSGATLASLANAFRTVFRATVSLEDLRAHDAHLRDLFDWYRNHAEDLQIETVTYYEQRNVGGVLSIVNPTSAHPGVGADPVGLDENHLSIAKPRDPDVQVCGAARDLLRRHVLASRAAPPPSFIRPGDGACHRIPHELPPAAETFFGRSAELTKLIARLRAGKNSAVVGPAGLGKTALAAEAVRAVIGETAASLDRSPFPNGVVFLDLYTFRGQMEPAWNSLANKLGGVELMERAPAEERAIEACQARRVLIVIEGGEEADGKNGRSDLRKLLSVFSPQNRRLLLTRLSTQAIPAESVELKEALQPEAAAKLLDSLTLGRVTGAQRDCVLELLEGHPLALTWAGSLLARDDEDAGRLVRDWLAKPLPNLSDPTQADHTLKHLFDRSVRGLAGPARQALAAAGLLARAPFPLAAIVAALEPPAGEGTAREVLQSLVQRSLLRRSERTDHWQFTHVLGYRFARQEVVSDLAVHKRLAHWLWGHLSAGLATDTGEAEPIVLAHTLEHAAALLRSDEGRKLWIPLARYLAYDACSRLADLGRLALANLALNAVAGCLDRFPNRKAKKPVWLRERTSLLDRRGDVLQDQGDLVGALASYKEAMGVRQRLAATHPLNSAWQRDLSISFTKVGEVLRKQYDLSGALASYRESLLVIQRLAAADLSNKAWQREMSVSQARVGKELLSQGNVAEALDVCQEALDVMQRLVATDPSNRGWQRDLSVSHAEVGEVLRAQGDRAGAMTVCQEALAIIKQLSKADPTNACWQRDLSVSHAKLGDILKDQGNLTGALAAYLESLVVIHSLASSNPSYAVWQRDLAFGHTRIALFHEDQGHRPLALLFAQESLKIDKRLAALDSTNMTWKQAVEFSLTLVARLRS